jgi:hypothetical protein
LSKEFGDTVKDWVVECPNCKKATKLKFEYIEILPTTQGKRWPPGCVSSRMIQPAKHNHFKRLRVAGVARD